MSDGKIIFETLLDETGLLKGLDSIDATAGQKMKVVGSAFEKTGGVMTKAFTAPLVGVTTAFMGTAEATREYRTEMGKLEAGFKTAGHTTAAAKDTYMDLYAVLGEEDTSVEAANHLAVLCDNEKDLSTWTDICTGVFATFGDSLPIEGLTEAANETAKVGKVTGPLADALNWVGISEDKFNESLAACSTEQERQALITETLNGLYGEASANYKTINSDVMAANKAQAKLTDAIARIGEVAEPIMTMLKDKAADLLNGLAGLIESFAAAPGWVQGLVLGFTGLLVAAGPLLVMFGKLAVGLGNIMDFSSRVRASIVKKTVATAADTAVTSANATATSLAAKAKMALNKALLVGKWMLIAGAIVAVTALLVAFVKDSDAATAMVQNFAAKVVEMVEKFSAVLPKIIEAIATMLPELINAGVTILQALLDGLVQALPLIMAVIPQIITSIVSIITENLPTLIEAAVQIIMALVDGMVQAIPQLVAAIPQIINALITAITENLPILIEAAIQIIMALVDGLVQAIPQLAAAIPQIIIAIVNVITMNLPTIINAAIQIIMALINGLVQAIPQLVAALPQIINAIVTGITENLPMIIEGAMQIIIALSQGLIEAIPQLVKALPKIIKAIVKGILSLLGQIFKVGVQILQKLWSGIKSWVGNLGRNVVNFAKSIPKKIKSGLGSLISVGKDWVKGLWNGIKNVKNWIMDKIKGFGKSCLNAIKKIFGINSPSKVMDKVVGRNLVYGLARGILTKTKVAVAAVKKQMSAVKDAYSATAVPVSMDFVPPVAQAYSARFVGGHTTRTKGASQAFIEQTVNINQPVETPWETARAIKNMATYGLAGAGGVNI